MPAQTMVAPMAMTASMTMSRAADSRARARARGAPAGSPPASPMRGSVGAFAQNVAQANGERPGRAWLPLRFTPPVNANSPRYAAALCRQTTDSALMGGQQTG